MLTRKVKIRLIFWAVGLVAGWTGFIFLLLPALALAAPLTVVIRDSYGKPLQGVMCEVLSYDWGLKVGQAYAVIASGETDQNGTVTFDASLWPYSGYRFKFSPTSRMQPATTFFEREDLNQYRGYPAAFVGGKAGTEYFFVAADGLTYNDLSDGKGSPTFQKNPVGGLENPRLTIMPAQNYLATVKVGTLAAEASGIPSPTLPPPPPPFKGVSGPLTLTPGASSNASNTANPVSPIPDSTRLANNPTSPIPPTKVASPPAQSGIKKPAGTAEDSGGFLGSLLLAAIGIVSFGLFLKFRHYFYWLLGLEGWPVKSQKATGGKTQAEDSHRKRLKIRANPAQAKEQEKTEYEPENEPKPNPSEPKPNPLAITSSEITEEE